MRTGIRGTLHRNGRRMAGLRVLLAGIVCVVVSCAGVQPGSPEHLKARQVVEHIYPESVLRISMGGRMAALRALWFGLAGEAGVTEQGFVSVLETARDEAMGRVESFYQDATGVYLELYDSGDMDALHRILVTRADAEIAGKLSLVLVAQGLLSGPGIGQILAEQAGGPLSDLPVLVEYLTRGGAVDPLGFLGAAEKKRLAESGLEPAVRQVIGKVAELRLKIFMVVLAWEAPAREAARRRMRQELDLVKEQPGPTF